MSRYAFAAVAALSTLLASSAAMAAGSFTNTTTASTPFSVKLKVVAGCTVNTTGLVNIGASTGIFTAAVVGSTGEGTVKATCTSGGTYGLEFGPSNTTSFTMRGTGGNTTTIPYTIRYTRGGSTVISTTTDLAPNTQYAFTGSGSEQSIVFTFTAGTPSVTPAAVDDYSDTVRVTMSY